MANFVGAKLPVLQITPEIQPLIVSAYKARTPKVGRPARAILNRREAFPGAAGAVAVDPRRQGAGAARQVPRRDSLFVKEAEGFGSDVH